LRFLYAQLQADLRAYLLTGTARYQDDFRAGLAQLYATLAEVQRQTRDDPAQQQALQALRGEFIQREAQFELALDTWKRGGVAAVAGLPASNPDIAATTTRVLDLLEQFRANERRRFAALENEDVQQQARLTLWVGLFFGLAVLIALWLSVQLLRKLKAGERADRQLRWQHYFSNAIIENLPVMLSIKDAATLRLVRVNKAVEKLTGQTREELLDKDERHFLPSADAEARIAKERAFIDGGEGELVEDVTLETSFGRRTLVVRNVVLLDENDRPAYLLGTSTDVTERLAQERQLRRFSEELAEKARALETANRELESFSYSVSHDLRAPLRAVDGYAAILEEDYSHAFDDEGRRYLRGVREGAARMGHLIQDLLAFSRLSRQALLSVPIETHELVEKAWLGVKNAQPATRATLQIDPLPVCHGDPRLLEQVWANLLENAAKYSSQVAQPAIRVSGEAIGDQTVFTVADNGAGFDMRYYDKLFQVFQRLHHEGEYPGTGVGLAIVHRIITRHGGRVWAESAPGAGARFHFSLPTP
jgi:PAS domain S-box-containing protein